MDHSQHASREGELFTIRPRTGNPITGKIVDRRVTDDEVAAVQVDFDGAMTWIGLDINDEGRDRLLFEDQSATATILRTAIEAT